ncbi:hypothetical protein ZHAS_00011355 [Anopheles sinensis]|uniref:Uncharacterized protein n=1 Tax=Anopheles sinensis TaxID=74873 RepID=A0A084VZZ9_ANOSI|nr:hypothetical protein ZHAS_00011355 [Anopheles sinensis]
MHQKFNGTLGATPKSSRVFGRSAAWWLMNYRKRQRTQMGMGQKEAQNASLLRHQPGDRSTPLALVVGHKPYRMLTAVAVRG